MVSIPFLPSFLSHLPLSRTPRHSCARVSSDSPSPSQAFHSDLAALLQTLSTHDDISSSHLLSFHWLSRSLDVVISAQASAKEAFHTRRMSSAGDAYNADKDLSKMMEQYLEDSVKLLDVCCLLREALTGVNAYVKASHLALKRLQQLKLVHQGDIQRARHALLSAKHVQQRVLRDIEAGASVRADVKSPNRLSACSSMLRRMGDKVAAPAPSELLYLEEPSTASMVSSALYGGEMCTLFFLRLLSTALCSQVSRKSSSSLQVSGQVAWAPSLLALQAQFNSELLQVAAQRRTERCNVTLVPEIHILAAAMSEIYEGLLQISSSKQAGDVDVKQLVDSTSKLTHNLQNSIARLQQQIDCIFSCLVDTRMAMLG